MQIIIISGPSGSGKTTLSKQILNKLKNCLILSTDNYYKTGSISKIISRLIKSYYDREISLNYKLLKKDLNYIIDTGRLNHSYNYDFQKKIVEKSYKLSKKIDFLIIEGIFAKKILENFYDQKYFFIELNTDKFICMKRVINRDINERGKSKKIAKNDFLNSWDIYYNKKNINKNVLNKFIYTYESNIDKLIEKILI